MCSVASGEPEHYMSDPFRQKCDHCSSIMCIIAYHKHWDTHTHIHTVPYSTHLRSPDTDVSDGDGGG